MATNDNLLASLEALKLESDVTKHEKLLDEIIENVDKDDITARIAVVDKLVQNGILAEIQKQLTKEGTNKAKLAQCLAEVAKVETIRSDCVQAGLVGPLLELMESTSVQNTTQACRALGNICFDNDEARGVVDQANGIQKLLQVMKTYLGRSGEGTNKLRIVLCGFLLNLTNTHESVQEKAIAHGALELLEEYLREHGSDTGTAQMALLTIGSLTDSEAGRDHLSDCNVAVTVGQLLASVVSRDLQDTIIDLLATLAESDEVKVQLAKSDVKNHLIRVIHSCDDTTDEELMTLERLTSDLIVLLLTGDESMDILYDNGEGVIFKEALAWLSAPSEQLQMCGSLAVGNFARNDERCVFLVKSLITEKLLALLTRGPHDVHPTLQHAVFSALRNLAIPAENKAKMLECGLISMALRYKDTDTTTVQFKLLGLLRMVVDKQEAAATQLGTNEDFMKRLMEWCQVDDHAGVKGEANRLSSWLVKNSQKAGVMQQVVRCGGVPFLVHMANAEHAVMQNEALVALTLIASSILDEATESFVSADLVPMVKVILTDDDSLPEIISNVFTLIKGLTPSEKLMELLKIAEIPDILKKLSKHEEKMVKEGAKGIAAIFDRG